MSTETVNQQYRKMDDDWENMWLELLAEKKSPPSGEPKGGEVKPEKPASSSGGESKTR